MDTYVELGEQVNPSRLAVYEQIAKAVSEIVPDGYVRFVAIGLDPSEGLTNVQSPNLAITSDVVERALADAEALIACTCATSGVDRVHTALHAYLRVAADKHNLAYAPDADITALMKVLLKGHPAVAQSSEQTNKIGRAFATIVDALNPLRNQQSMAHPNVSLLAPAEAMLVINSVRTLPHYLDANLR
ncbi:MAG TPA: abortive infection family protein [Candidatus Sulfotelmatobacter sp.]|nr:abortive infection family protein [Candidatus Sulfotelmatobacter sp.]